jgi:hypothetical protein
VGEFVTGHVDGAGEGVEQPAVTVAVDHLVAVPEGVVVVLAVVDGGIERQSGTVDGVALVHLRVQVEGRAEPVVVLVDGLVAARSVSLLAYRVTRELLLVLGVVDGALRRRHGGGLGSGTRRDPTGYSPGPVGDERVAGDLTQYRITGALGDTLQYVGRNDCASHEFTVSRRSDTGHTHIIYLVAK